MRLIDADDFFNRMNNDTGLCAEMEFEGLKALKKYLDLQPTAYSVDKVIEELEKLADESYKAYCIAFNSDDRAEYDAYTNAIEIVEQGDVSDDVCQWKLDGDMAINPHTFIKYKIKQYDSLYALDTCPYCGKKIKVVE